MVLTNDLVTVAAQSSTNQIRPGDRVRVVAGLLSGLIGVVSRQSDDATVLFTVWGREGVYIRINAAALESSIDTIDLTAQALSREIPHDSFSDVRYSPQRSIDC
jgi:preprotein translocase subunit YajC